MKTTEIHSKRRHEKVNSTNRQKTVQEYIDLAQKTRRLNVSPGYSGLFPFRAAAPNTREGAKEIPGTGGQILYD